MARRARIGILLFVACALLGSCTGQGKPNILPIVIDRLRADRLGCYGSRRGLTPFLDSLAARGVVFRRAYAAASWTNPSVSPGLSLHAIHGFRLSPE